MTTAVKNLLLRELKLTNLVLPVVMGSLCLLMLIPIYPLYVGLMYMCLVVFFTVMHFRKANDVYSSMLLSIRKRDAVRARMLLCCLFEIAQLVVAIPVAVLRNVLYESNPTGIEANPALFDPALIMLTVLSSLLLTIHYKAVHNIGAPFVVADMAVLLYIGLAEVLIHIVPFLRIHLDVVDEHVEAQLIVLTIGATVFITDNIPTYRVAAAHFKRVDLRAGDPLSPFTGGYGLPDYRISRGPGICEVFLMRRWGLSEPGSPHNVSRGSARYLFLRSSMTMAMTMIPPLTTLNRFRTVSEGHS